jgi:outer membrane biosynthesis protein TonB
MKLLSPHILLVAILMMGLFACAAAPPSSGSKEFIATDAHEAPPPPPPPPSPTSTATSSDDFLPDVVIVTKSTDDTFGSDKGTLAQGDPKKESVLEPAKPVLGDGARARGQADPLAAPGFGGGEGGTFQGQGSGIASNAKGASHHGAGTGAAGSTDSSGPAPGAAMEVRGSIDKSDIQRVVRAHINEVKHCYEQGLTKRPDLEGKVLLKFTIGKTGTVVAAKVEDTTLNDRPVEQCIAGAAMRWSFPKPSGDGLVVIAYPFILKSAN